MSAVLAVNGSEYNLALAEGMVPLVAEFFAITEREVWERLEYEFESPGSTVADAWRLAKPNSPDEVMRFYRETDSYVYDLVVDHCHFRRGAAWSALMARIERLGFPLSVLLYGDGIGTDSIAIARCGHQITYFDLPGVTSAFARFRFERENPANLIAVIEAEADIPAKAFDVAVCIEVLEHVPDPPAVMRALHRALRHGGIALITESFESVGDEFPSHLPENLRYAGQTHQLMEGIGFANTYYNKDPVNRPMEFTKVGSDLSGAMLKVKGKLHRAVESRWRRVFELRARGTSDQ